MTAFETKTDVSPIPYHYFHSILFSKNRVSYGLLISDNQLKRLYVLDFVKISALLLKLNRGPVSILQMINGQNSVNNVGGVTVGCIFSYDAYICTKFHENSFSRLKVIK